MRSVGPGRCLIDITGLFSAALPQTTNFNIILILLGL